jgi:uncharacterized membrane protein YqhA
MRKVLSNSRYFVMIAVVMSFIAAMVTLVYGAIQMMGTLVWLFQQSGNTDPTKPLVDVLSSSSKKLVVALIEAIDMFLLGTVFYITSLGLYELFIDDRVQVPEWLEIHSIDDLKGKLISVVVVVLGVLFLGKAVSWNGEENFLPFGVSTASVIASLTYFLSAKNKQSNGKY